jgi:hypothetical protein
MPSGGRGGGALFVQRMATSQHPTLRLNLSQPVSHRGNPAEVFQYVLLANESDRDYTASRDRDRGAEDIFQHEDARGVMPEGSVPEVSHVGLGTVEPFMEPKVFMSFAAVLLG